MSFVLEGGLKDGLFPGILPSLVSVDSLVNFFIHCKLRQHRDLRIQKGNEGSNPTLSASKSVPQRKSAAICPEICETCLYFAIFRPQTGPERTDCLTAKGATTLAFLWRAHAQSSFEEGDRLMQCDHKPGIRPS